MLVAVARFDRVAMRWMASRRRRWATVAMAALTYTGAGAVWGCVAGLLAVLCRVDVMVFPRQETLLAAMFGAGLSLLVGQGVKRAIGRVRPYRSLPDAPAAIRPPRDASFPSTHTSTAIALLVGLTLTGHPLAPWIAPWALAIPLTRFYLGVHYPSDIAAGAALGALFGLWDYTGLMSWALALGR